MSDFKYDLGQGQIAEDLVLDIIKKKYPNARRIHGHQKAADIYVPEIDKFVEVKYDEPATRTDNFFIEIEMYGEKSGLMVTEADYWVLFDGFELVWITPLDLKDIIIWHELKSYANENNMSRAFLVKRQLAYAKGTIQNINS